MTGKIFISYSRANIIFARLLYNELQDLGFDLWQDVHEIPGGADFWKIIKTAIEGCDTLILCMSLHALKSPVVSDEWNYARALGKRVIPVIADEVFNHPDVITVDQALTQPELMTTKFVIPNWMRRANWLDFRDVSPHKIEHKRRLLTDLRTPYQPKQIGFTARARQLPHNYVPRPAEYEPLVRAIVSEQNDAVAITTTVGLRGAGGFGKTTLAKALARDLRVSGAYDDGIYWVTLGEALTGKSGDALEGELVSRMLDLIYEITGARPPISRLESAVEELTKALADRYALLIVDDVWHKAHLEPFLVKGKHNAVLVTTRNDSTLPRDAVRQEVGAMAPDDSLRVLTAGLIDTKQITDADISAHTSELTTLAHRLGGWALLLSLVNGALYNRVREFDASLAEAVAYVNKRLDKYGLTAFDAEDAVQRQDAVTSTLNASLDRLKPAARERYHLLGIFAEDAAVPVSAAAAAWGLDDADEAADQLELFAKASLLLDFDGKAFRLHDVIRVYLRSQITDLPAANHSLIANWGSLYALPDEYAWRYIGYHLFETQQSEKLRALLLDYRWLYAKLWALDHAAIIADIDRFHLTIDESLRLLRSALMLSETVLMQDKRQLAAQLTGRLRLYAAQPEIDALFQSTTAHDGFLCLNGKLTSAGGPLLRTLVGHTGPVTGALQLRDGRILSWAKDQNLQLWQADGKPLTQLVGHTGVVRGAFELDDGRIFTWGSGRFYQDKSLCLWSSDGELLPVSFEGAGNVYGAVALSGSRFLTWSQNESVRIWSLDGRYPSSLIGRSDSIDGALELQNGCILTWETGRPSLSLWRADGKYLSEIHRQFEPAFGALAGNPGTISGVLELRDGRILSWSNSHLSSSDVSLRVSHVDESYPVAQLIRPASSLDGALELSDGRILFWSSKMLYIWAMDDQPLIELSGHSSSVRAALELRDGRILSWAWDETLCLWSTAGQLLAVLSGHTGTIVGALELEDGRLLSWAGDKTLRLWKADGQPLTALIGHTDAVMGASVLRDGHILSWGNDHLLCLWSTEEQTPVENNHAETVRGTLELYNGQVLTWSGDIFGSDSTLHLWHADGTHIQALAGHTAPVTGAIQLRDERILTWARGSDRKDNTLHLWSSAHQSFTVFAEHTDSIKEAVELRNGCILSWGENESTVRLSSNDGELLNELKGHSRPVSGVLQLRDGRILTRSWDKTLRLWSEDGQLITQLNGHFDRVSGATELEDGRLLSWSWDNTLRLWNPDGSPLAQMAAHKDRVLGALELQNGCIISWALKESGIHLWNAEGKLQSKLSQHAGTIRGAIMRRDGSLVSWASDPLICVWDMDGKLRAQLIGHTGGVEGVIELNDDRLLSWSDDKTIQLWRVNGEKIDTFYNDAAITSCAMLRDGKTLVAGDTQGHVIFLRLPIG